MHLLTFSVRALILLQISKVFCFKDSPGGCVGGKAAVDGPHIVSNGTITVLSQTLDEAQVQVKVGNVVLLTNSTTLVPADIGHEIRVDMLNGTDFGGAMIRLEIPSSYSSTIDTSDFLIPDLIYAEPNRFCIPPIVGIAHREKPVLKRVANGTLFVDADIQGIVIDVTVVFSLQPVSRYAYGRFVLNSFGSKQKQTLAPQQKTSVPVPRPQPTREPTLTPIRAPQQPSALAPIRRRPRTMAPTQRPTRRPRTMKPTLHPTRRRRRPRTTIPTKKPTKRPRAL